MTRANGTSAAPGDRTILAVGEAKPGETVGTTHLRRLETARAAHGTKAARARLLLFATAFTEELRTVADGRGDTELVDLDRLYHGE